ncbi:MATE family efflux transporter [Rappaport israeli]|uniref:MATE family efflux transporter n=1 Tax=Rappaport israeli TaxID=1839807 RepID=UPI00093130FD|nr:MATE family efflux transporter [Rappaport israeli]
MSTYKNLYWHELKGTLRLGFPLIFSQLLGYAQQVIDTLMAGRHNALTLAAVSLAGQLFTLVYLLMIGIGIAISASVSRYHGRQDPMRIRRSFQQGQWLMLFLALLSIVLIIAMAYVPSLIGSAEDIAQEAKRYLLTLALGAGLYVLALTPRYFLEGMSYPRTNILITLALLPLNVFLNWAFLSGWSIFPALGAQGMALATAICYSLYAFLLFWQLIINPQFRALRLFQRFAPPNWFELKTLIRIGVPISLAIIMEAALFIAIGLIASRSNAILTGANQIALNYAGVMFMIPLGLASALTVRVGNAIGQNNLTIARIRSLGGIALSAFVMLFSGALMLFFAKEIASLYSDNSEVIDIASHILIIVAIFQIFDGIQITAAGVLRGLHDTNIAMLYALIGYWILGFPLGLYFAYVLGYGLYGLWAGVAIGLIVNAFLSTRRVLQKTRPTAS